MLGLFLIERLQVNALHVWELMLWNEVGTGTCSIMLSMFIVDLLRAEQ